MDKKLGDLVESVEQIKRLLIIGLLRSGASQADIAKGLGVNQSSISRLLIGKPGEKTNKKK